MTSSVIDLIGDYSTEYNTLARWIPLDIIAWVRIAKNPQVIDLIRENWDLILTPDFRVNNLYDFTTNLINNPNPKAVSLLILKSADLSNFSKYQNIDILDLLIRSGGSDEKLDLYYELVPKNKSSINHISKLLRINNVKVIDMIIKLLKESSISIEDLIINDQADLYVSMWTYNILNYYNIFDKYKYLLISSNNPDILSSIEQDLHLYVDEEKINFWTYLSANESDYAVDMIVNNYEYLMKFMETFHHHYYKEEKYLVILTLANNPNMKAIKFIRSLVDNYNEIKLSSAFWYSIISNKNLSAQVLIERNINNIIYRELILSEVSDFWESPNIFSTSGQLTGLLSTFMKFY